jgi:proteasome lid subunit RPN8/RPN11
MSGIDVRDLTNEQLTASAFPAESRADFRLHIAPEARRGIEQHAKADVSVEICGVLVGHWGQDENGPYAAVTNYIRCDNASSKVAEVTFTHEAWAQINKEMDSKYADKRIVGWYHSHPDFGIFLSDRDCFIHEHFFSGPGQVAFVIDPVRDLEGVFAWRNGKPTLLSYYWVGDNIRSGAAGQRNGAVESPMHAVTADQSHRPQLASSFGSQPFGIVTTSLALLTVFLLGYLYAGWRTDWEQRMMMAGAVAHFADTKLIRDGLQEEVSAVQSRLTAVNKELQELPEPAAKLSKKEHEEAAKRRKFVTDNLALCEEALKRIEQQYALSEVEKDVLAQIVAIKQSELRRQMDAEPAREGKQKVDAAAARQGKENKNEPKKPTVAPATNAQPQAPAAKKRGVPATE